VRQRRASPGIRHPRVVLPSGSLYSTSPIRCCLAAMVSVPRRTPLAASRCNYHIVAKMAIKCHPSYI
jgi:hypothetical protein